MRVSSAESPFDRQNRSIAAQTRCERDKESYAVSTDTELAVLRLLGCA